MARMTGVFGGTFDPPHLGHLLLAIEGLERLELEKVLWVLTPFPPHKPDFQISPIEIRMEMLGVVLRDEPEFQLSKADIDRDPPHYALGTMEWLEEKYPEGEFVYLMGSDSLRDLPTWYRPAEFVSKCKRLGVLQRPGIEVDLDKLEGKIPGLRSKMSYFHGPSIDITGRDIRQRVKLGRRYDHLLAPGVAEVIRTRGLYR
jgi:nicotinate-nucleotide adenylyltransferase